jgi:hypothetical protein
MELEKAVPRRSSGFLGFLGKKATPRNSEEPEELRGTIECTTNTKQEKTGNGWKPD